ncbi:MAG: AI-2E family transporter [Candidatus Pacebacteria bacterium]|nr:AI-2E family transporter [Candidatus Paceibacterota bacterium]
MNNNNRTTIDISSKSIIRVILFGSLVVAFIYLRDLILVLLTAIVIASFVESGVRFLGKRKVGRTLSVVIIYIVSLAILSGIFYLFIPVVVSQIDQLSKIVTHYLPQIQQFQNAGNFNISQISEQGTTIEHIASTFKNITQGTGGGFFTTLVAVFGGIANLVLIVVISFYLSIEEKGIEKFLRIITPANQEAYVLSLWERTRKKISRWIQGQMFLGLVIGVLAFIGLSLLHIQYALVIALVAGLFELVPFGMILATVPAVLLGYASGGTTTGLMTLGFFVVLQQIENYILVPLIIKRATGVPSLIVILSLLIGLKLAGFWGIILAMPVAVFLLELFADIEQKKIFEKENTDNV